MRNLCRKYSPFSREEIFRKKRVVKNVTADKTNLCNNKQYHGSPYIALVARKKSARAQGSDVTEKKKEFFFSHPEKSGLWREHGSTEKKKQCGEAYHKSPKGCGGRVHINLYQTRFAHYDTGKIDWKHRHAYSSHKSGISPVVHSPSRIFVSWLLCFLPGR